MAKKIKKKTQKEQVLAFLQLGLKLNPLIAQREFGCIGSTLAYYIHELRAEGWRIHTENKTSKYNNSRYAEYSLPPSWRSISECEFRASLKDNRPVTLTSLRLGVRVKLKNGEVGQVVGLYKSGMLIVNINHTETLIYISDVKKQLRR